MSDEGNQEIMLSVVIPTYNAELWIEECLGSLQEQSMEAWEAVVVNDCSTDGTRAILEEIARNDERVRLFDQPENQGPSMAINKGLDNCRGAYILIMGADDKFAAGSFERMVGLCKQDDLDILRFSLENFADGEGLEKDVEYANQYCLMPVKDSGVMAGAELLALEQEKRGAVPAHPVQLCYKKELVDELGLRYIPGIIYEDNAWTYDFMLAAKRARMVDDSFYLRRLHRKSLTGCVERDVVLDFVSWFTVLGYVRNLAVRYWDDERLHVFFMTKLAEIHAGCLDSYRQALLQGIDLPIADFEPADFLDFNLEFGFYEGYIAALRDMEDRVANAERAVSGFEKSPSYRVGRVVTALPRWVRNRVSGKVRR